MASNSPTLAFVFALISVLLYFAGLGVLSFFPIAVVGLLFVITLFSPPEREPMSGRIASFLALNLALLPLYLPMLAELRYQHLEARRAAQTAPLYSQLDDAVENVTPLIDTYFERHGHYPELDADNVLPHVDQNGRLQRGPSMEGLRAPVDPFHPSRLAMRWVAIRDHGVLLSSIGQSGVSELPLPGVAMDGPPSHPLARFALIGDDPRWRTYDPTNGALGLGDILRFHGTVPYEEAMEPLFNAWNLAHRRSQYREEDVWTRAGGTGIGEDRQSARDAREAQGLLNEGQYLAALALASRAHRQRPPESIWRDSEYTVDRTRGLALYELAAYREAADALIDYLDVVPNDARAHFYLGAALHRGGDQSNALVHLAAASQIDPTSDISNLALQQYQLLEAGQMPNFPEPRGLPR